MSHFKYLKKEHLDGFFQRGSLKIGTLNSYRDEELYGSAVGDKDEGKHSVVFNMPGSTFDIQDKSPEANFLRHSPLFDFQGSGVTFSGKGKIVHNSHSSDLYIFCVSNAFDANVMDEFGGACFEIIRPAEFLDEVSKVIQKEGKFLGIAPISYRGRESDWKHVHNLHPSLLKEPKHAYQNESRAAWDPVAQPIKNLFIDAPLAVSHCRIVAPAR